MILDYGKTGKAKEGSKVLRGTLKKFYIQNDEEWLLIQEENGPEHRCKAADHMTMWMGMWAHGLNVGDVPAPRESPDSVAQVFMKLSLERRNELLTRIPLHIATFRIALGSTPASDRLMYIKTSRYEIYDVEDIALWMTRALPEYDVEILSPSTGLDSGAAIAWDEPYDHSHVGVYVDSGPKDGKSPVIIRVGARIEGYLFHFDVYTPRLKRLRKGYLDDERPYSFQTKKLMHMGKQRKNVVDSCREYAILAEMIDWLCQYNKNLPFTPEQAHERLMWYVENTDMFSLKTYRIIGRWEGDNFHDFCIYLRKGADTRYITAGVSDYLKQMAAEQMILSEIWEDLWE